MPVKKEDLSILGIKEEKVANETTKHTTLDVEPS